LDCIRCGTTIEKSIGKCDQCDWDPDRVFDPMAGFRRGDHVQQRYEIKGTLGNGQLGPKLLAHDHQTGKQVALKILHPALLPGKKDSLRFVQAMQSLAARRLPQAVPVLHADIDDNGRCFLANKLLKGATLRDILEKRKAKNQLFTIEEILPIVEQITEVLDPRTDRVHGAITPERIWVFSHQFQVSGMGIAENLPPAAVWYRLRSSGTSVNYVAPELEFGAPWNPKIDVYALGALIGELYTGVPYGGVIDTYSTDNPDLNAILTHALDRRTTRRFETPVDLLHALTILTDTARLQMALSIKAKKAAQKDKKSTGPEEPDAETIRDKMPQFPDDTTPDGQTLTEEIDEDDLLEEDADEESTLVDAEVGLQLLTSKQVDSAKTAGKPKPIEADENDVTTDQVAMEDVFEERHQKSLPTEPDVAQGWSRRTTSAVPSPADSQMFPDNRDTDTDDLLVEFHADTSVKELEVTDSDIDLLDEDEDDPITATEEFSDLSEAEVLLELEDISDETEYKDHSEEHSYSSALMAVYRLEQQAEDAEKETVDDLLRHAERLDGVDPRLVRAAHELETKRRSDKSKQAAEILRKRAADLDGIDPRLLRAAARLQQSKEDTGTHEKPSDLPQEKAPEPEEDKKNDDNWRERMGNLADDTAVSFLDSSRSKKPSKKSKKASK